MGLFNGFNANRSPIAIDLGSRRIKAVQLTRSGGEVSVLASSAFGSEITSPDADVFAEADRIVSVLSRQGFVGQTIALAPPRSCMMSSELEVPHADSGAPIDQIVRMELARTHRMEPAAFEMAWWELPPSGHGTQSAVMACSCAHETLSPFLDAFGAAGCQVIAAELPELALVRVFSAGTASQKGVVTMVEIGWAGTLVVVLVDGRVVYTRPIATGLRSAVESVAEQRGIGSEAVEALLTPAYSEADASGQFEDIRSTIGRDLAASIAGVVESATNYAADRYAADAERSIVICGGIAALDGLVEDMTTAVGIAASVLTPVSAVAGSASKQAGSSMDPGMCVAAGVALRFDRL